LRDRAQIAQLPLDRIHGLIHVAAATPGASEDFFEDNLLGTANLIAALSGAPLRNVVLVSSVSIYDWRTPYPGPVLLREDSSLLASDQYGRSKLIQEWLIQSFATSRMPVCTFRPSSIYGPGMALRSVLPLWVIQSLRGEALRLSGARGYRQNFVYVEDVAALICRAFAERVDGVFNLFSPATLELPALADLVQKLTGNIRPVEDARQDAIAPQLVFDNRRLLNRFEPSFTPLPEALRATVNWLSTTAVAMSNTEADGNA
jgi:nucleoside-diphosphate-sugar epimerase